MTDVEHRSTIVVDSLIIGDTPFALSVQDTLRDMGETTFLIYTGVLDYRYVYVEDIHAPHTKVSYQISTKEPVSSLRASEYKNFFRDRLRGDYAFFYGLVDKAVQGPQGQFSVSSVRASVFSESGRGYYGEPTSIATLNKWVEIFDTTIHYDHLVVTENLRSFLPRVGMGASFPSSNLGVVVEESVTMAPGTVSIGALWGPTSAPLLSISRGFLTYHYFGHTDHVNVILHDYIRQPTQELYDIIEDLESRSVYLVGPRALWNSGLTFVSETDRLRYLYS